MKKWLQKGQAPFSDDALAAVVFDFHKNEHYNKKKKIKRFKLTVSNAVRQKIAIPGLKSDC